jgi:hypothetical protein
MTDSGAHFLIETETGRRRVELAAYLDPRAVETAERDANAWIKTLRHARVDGVPLRDRFSYRGDSLWWFAELYLHKKGVIGELLKTIFALEALLGRERPSQLTLVNGGRLASCLAPQIAAKSNTRYDDRTRSHRWRTRISPRTVLRSYADTVSSIAAHLRSSTGRFRGSSPPEVVAFLHMPFWSRSSGSQSALEKDVYVGPVLGELASRLAPGQLQLVGIGPRTIFRARGLWQRLTEFIDPGDRATPLTPIARYARLSAMRGSLRAWRSRGANCRALLASADLRQASVLRGYDAWPIILQELAGIALLQFPWSARAMDEAAAVLDATRPKAILTYAEAGNWGRALALEARRRGIRSAGLQHGFIYRHWLNYLHEPDEMQPSSRNPKEVGFPRPDVTLLDDKLAAGHLMQAGHFPEKTVVVTGSAKLDALVQAARQFGPERLASIRERVGAKPAQYVVVVASKFTQIQGALGPLVRAIETMPDVQLTIKCHPAETPEPYRRVANGITNVTVIPSSEDLAALLAVARLVVSVNSTVAIDAMVLGVPSLILELPNNLSPFVEAGVMVGADDVQDITPTMRCLLYDESLRVRLAKKVQAFLDSYAITSDGRAAHRSADAIMALVER